MQLRLAILNIAVPLLMLFVLGFIPAQELPAPAYLMIGLLIFTIGRAFLLLLQQTIFSVLPVILIAVPEQWAFGFKSDAPFVMDAIFIYLAVVNFQWGQRPWLHGVHWLNNGLLMLIIFLGFEPFAFPKGVLTYESMSVFWTGAIMITLVLAFSMYWQRLGRWAAFWSLLGVWAYALNWGQGQYALLWVSLATLFSLTIDSYAMAFIDELTGIPGRRAMEFKLKTIGKDYLLAMADVDHFKKFNDNHGHQVGDDVLKMVANVLSKTSKSNVYRYGGEEFVLVFSRSDSEDVYKYLDKTRESLEQYNLYPKSQKRERDKSGKDKRGKGSERKPLHITASFGLARQKGSEPYHYVISRADKALYKAKENGRNRIEVSK
jgi:diguanylate cyclase (GGDEF)-like protein